MIEMFNGATGEMIGTLTEHQLDELIDYLADGGGSEKYVIDKDTIGFLKTNGVDKETVKLLDGALGKARTVTIEYHIQDETDIEMSAEE